MAVAYNGNPSLAGDPVVDDASPGRRLSTEHGHRGGLAAQVATIWPRPDLFERVGGRQGVARIIDTHYDSIETDPELFGIFRSSERLDRRRQKMFFEEWMGGEPLYSRHVSTQGTRLFHYIFPITAKAAGRWLRHFTNAMRSQGLPEAVVRETLQVLGPMARALVRPAARGLPRQLRSAGDEVAHALSVCLEEDPDLLRHHSADFERLLFGAAKKGQLETVRHLLQLGVDGNKPTWQDGVFLTPWCIARQQGHDDVADHLLRWGAVVDIYSAAFLGDAALVESLLQRHPQWLNSPDPASDHQGIPPVCYAIRGGHYGLARRLLAQGAELGPQTVHWVRSLAEGDAAAVGLAAHLIDLGSDMSTLGPGRWVLQPCLVERLRQRDVDVNRPPGAWLRYCSHQVGGKEDAALVAALLDYGADAEARLDGCSALHLAVRAGYAETVEVLLQHGCDVDAEDATGNTPLGYLIFAHRRADRPALARRLLAAGADPGRPDRQGVTPLERARRASFRGAPELVEILRGA